VTRPVLLRVFLFLRATCVSYGTHVSPVTSPIVLSKQDLVSNLIYPRIVILNPLPRRPTTSPSEKFVARCTPMGKHVLFLVFLLLSISYFRAECSNIRHRPNQLRSEAGYSPCLTLTCNDRYFFPSSPFRNLYTAKLIFSHDILTKTPHATFPSLPFAIKIAVTITDGK
jgi:hypothetical protein